MKDYIITFFYALRLGIGEGYQVFLKELIKYRSFRELQKRRVF
jgi:hypothetical protein